MATGFFHALSALLPLLLATSALFVLSRVVFARLLAGAAAALFPRSGGVAAFAWLRAPANLVHEVSHAVAAWVSGYRVAELRFSFNDPDRRGLCRTGAPWAPWAVPAVRDLAVGLSPLAAGALLLPALASVTGVELPHPDLGGSAADVARDLAGALRDLDWGAPRTWAFFAGAVLLGAEAHPSAADFRIAGPPLAVAVLLWGCLGALAAHLPAHAAALAAATRPVVAALSWMTAAATCGALALAVALGVLGPPLWLARRIGGGR